MTTLIAFNVIHPSLHLTIVLAVVLLLGNRMGRRVVSALLERERLIAGA